MACFGSIQLRVSVKLYHRWPVTSWSPFLDAAAAAASAPGAAGGRVCAPIPGKVTKLIVAEGDQVALCLQDAINRVLVAYYRQLLISLK